MGASDQDIQNAIEEIFAEFDKDGSGYLERPELAKFINAIMSSLGSEQQVGEEEVNEALAEMDANNDGKVAKGELLEIFKKFEAQQ